MTEERRKKLGLICKYATIAAAGVTVICGAFTTLDYTGKWFNQATTAITELGQVKVAIARHEVEQREDLKDIKRELGELRQDMTRLLLLSKQPPERVRVAGKE